MTSPIATLGPMLGADPAPAPAPAEDPALFAAALIAAMQSAMIPVPVVMAAPGRPVLPPPPTSEQPAQSGDSAPEGDPTQSASTPSQQSPALGTPRASPVAIGLVPQRVRLGATVVSPADDPHANATPSPQVGGPSLPTPASVEVVQSAASVGAGEGEIAQSSQALSAAVPPAAAAVTEAPPLGASPAAQPFPVAQAAHHGQQLAPPDVPMQGRLEAPQDSAQAPATDRSGEKPKITPFAPAEAGPSSVRPAESTAIALPAIVREAFPVPLTGNRRIDGVNGRRKGDRAEAGSAQRPAPEAANALIAMPAAFAATMVPLPPVGIAVDASQAEPPDGSGGGADATPARTSPEVSASESPAGALSSGSVPPHGTTPTGDNAQQGLGFFRSLASALGDAEIGNIRVTLGRPGRVNRDPIAAGDAVPTGDAPPPGGNEGGARSMPGSAQVAAVPRAVESSGTAPRATAAPVAQSAARAAAPLPPPDDDMRVLSTGARSTPVLDAAVAGPREPAVAARPVRRAVTPTTRNVDGAPRSQGSATEQTVRVRVAQPALQRSAPDELPGAAARGGRADSSSRAPNLPATRQELPAALNPDNRSVTSGPRVDEAERVEPSDAQSRGSVPAGSLTDPVGRSDSRPREAAAGEARNMPDRSETKDRPAGLADRVTLQVGDGDGRQTRIKVTVQGDQVRAVILPGDQESGRQLEQRMDELQAALVRQGFADPKVSVQSVSHGPGGAVPWGAAPGGTTTENAASRGMDRPADEQGQGSGRREQDRHGDGQRHSQQRFRHRDPDDRQNQDG